MRWSNVLPRLNAGVAAVAQAVGAADVRFVSWSHALERSLLRTAGAMTAQASELLPDACYQAAALMRRIARETEPTAGRSTSLVVNSVPAAARRTGDILERIGNRSVKLTGRGCQALFGGTERDVDSTDEELERIGRTVVELTREGLDVAAVALSLRSQLLDLLQRHPRQWGKP